MKELEGAPFSIEAKINAEQKIESRLIGRVYLKPGQHMYWYDPQTNIMDQVRLKQTQFEQGQAPKQETRVVNGQIQYTIHEPNAKYANTMHSQASWDSSKLYCVAINDKNASKKFAKMLFDLTTKHK